MPFIGDVFNWQKPDTNGETFFAAIFPITMIERFTVEWFKVEVNAK